MANTTGKKFGGRQKGTPNKATEDARKAFQKIMEGNVGRVEKALAEIYNEDKKQFLEVLSRYFPYFLPKQQEIDITVDNHDLPFEIEISHREKKDIPE